MLRWRDLHDSRRRARRPYVRLWTFGDADSTGRTRATTYTGGTYTVSLSVTTAHGSDAKTKTATSRHRPVGAPTPPFRARRPAGPFRLLWSSSRTPRRRNLTVTRTPGTSATARHRRRHPTTASQRGTYTVSAHGHDPDGTDSEIKTTTSWRGASDGKLLGVHVSGFAPMQSTSPIRARTATRPHQLGGISATAPTPPRRNPSQLRGGYVPVSLSCTNCGTGFVEGRLQSPSADAHPADRELAGAPLLAWRPPGPVHHASPAAAPRSIHALELG